MPNADSGCCSVLLLSERHKAWMSGKGSGMHQGRFVGITEGHLAWKHAITRCLCLFLEMEGGKEERRGGDGWMDACSHLMLSWTDSAEVCSVGNTFTHWRENEGLPSSLSLSSTVKAASIILDAQLNHAGDLPPINKRVQPSLICQLMNSGPKVVTWSFSWPRGDLRRKTLCVLDMRVCVGWCGTSCACCVRWTNLPFANEIHFCLVFLFTWSIKTPLSLWKYNNFSVQLYFTSNIIPPTQCFRESANHHNTKDNTACQMNKMHWRSRWYAS